MVVEFPTEEQQCIASDYVLCRPLHRPNTSFGKACLCVFLFLAITALTGIGLWYWSEASLWTYFPETIKTFRTSSPGFYRFWFFFGWFLLCTLFSARFAAIGAVRLYQRYAAEDVRRRCLLMPTCSEYCILVLQKYGFFLGMIKTFIRLFYTCKGWSYRIDYP